MVATVQFTKATTLFNRHLLIKAKSATPKRSSAFK
jgi:hypothetical protein